MGKNENLISLKKATEQVRLMANRTALLYYFLAQVMDEAIGEEETKKILKEAILRYGSEIGEKVRDEVIKAGLPLTLGNYNKKGDLPCIGWEGKNVKSNEGKEEKNFLQVDYCPLAETWLKKGEKKYSRIYCFVDQAKYWSYNGTECKHLKNLLDGDKCCLFDFIDPKERRGKND